MTTGGLFVNSDILNNSGLLWANGGNVILNGAVTVSDGTHTSNVALLGQYSLSSFSLAADPTGGTLLLNNHPLV